MILGTTAKKHNRLSKDIEAIKHIVFNTSIKASTLHMGKTVEITKDNFTEVLKRHL